MTWTESTVIFVVGRRRQGVNPSSDFENVWMDNEGTNEDFIWKSSG